MLYHNNQDALGSALTPNNAITLKGAGLSLEWQGERGIQFKLSVARRISTNPLANAQTNADSDGTLRLNRVWFNANWAF
jgi:hypothetical protein